jgi:PhnB protein
MAKLPRPDGHHVVTPSFIVPNAAKAIAFVAKTFGGVVVDRYDGPDGAVMHAELKIGDSIIMCGEPMPGWTEMPAALSVYVDDGPAVDAAFKKALANGATAEHEPTDQFYGYRTATVRDVTGNRWTICAVIENLTREEMHRRASAAPH